MNTGKDQDMKIKQKVFLVDDHPIVREGLSQLISREKDLAVCGEAGDISSALQSIANSKPNVVVVDLTLESGSGLRVIENIKYDNPDLPVLVLSMHDESVYAERCIKAGARGYIMKQEPSDKMISAIRNVLEGKLYVSSSMEKKFLNNFVSGKVGDFHSPDEILSRRELEVYQLFGKGLRKKDIAGHLNLSVKTIETYIENIKKKMNFKSIHEIIMNSVRFQDEDMK
ncbi:MAG TPA: response regulator transcription factor [bacterium]|nr:response regulator transcription factor [bacterium]